MNTFRALRVVITQYWGVSDAWTRGPLIILAVWPLVLIVVALFGWTFFTSSISLFPLLPLLVLLLVSPTFTGALWVVEETKGGLKLLAVVVGIELLFGWYLTVIPIANDRSLVPLLILTVAALTLFTVGLERKRSGFVTTTLLVAFFVLTAIFLLGGRKEAKSKTWDHIFPDSVPATNTTTAVQSRSCEAWERTYAVITPETFPGDTLRVGPEQTWVFRLVDEEEWIGWIIADVKSWSVPTDSNEIRFPNGLVIVETPQNTRQISYPSNTFNVRGEGCRLMTTKRILAASLGLL